MAVTLGSNIPSLRTQRSLANATRRVETSLEKLASGMRINRASDDAAGLAVATTLSTSARFYSTASRNINDGISSLNIVDSTLSNQTGILGRMLELAEQSANGTYSSTQRGSLQSEYLALQKEFSRLADTTIFNGLYLLRGDRSNGTSTLNLQAGITGASNSAISVRTGDTSYLSGTFNIRALRGGTGGDYVDGTFDLSDYLRFSDTVGKSPSSEYNSVFYTQVKGSDGNIYDVALAAFEYTDDGQFGSDYNHTGSVAVNFGAFYKKQDGTWGVVTGIPNAIFVGGNDFYINFNESTGQAYSNSVSGSGTTISTSVTLGSTTGTLNLDFSSLKFFANEDTTQQTAIDLTGVENVTRAKESLTIVRNRMNDLNALRGVIGATMNRLLVANQVVLSTRENSQAAASRITDTDIAGESGELTRQSILQQVATSILAQANQLPSLALRLLQG